MIDERFSAPEFEKERDNRRALRARADLLQEEIAKELGRVMVPAMEAIVERLNRLGHDLRLHEGESGNVGYRDDYEDESGYDCKLRVAYDYTVSAGYADILFSKSNPEGLYPHQIRDELG